MVQWGDFELVYIVQRVTSACSLLGSSTICFLFFYLGWWNSSTHHVILFSISIADIIYSSAIFAGPWVSNSHTWCTIQGWALQLFGLSAQFWCTILVLNLWLQMNFYWADRKCRALMPWYHAFAWGIPLILATLPAAQDFMVATYVWCWMKPDEYRWQIWTIYIPLWVNLGCNVSIIAMIVRLLNYVIASIPEEMDNASKMKRHYRLVTCHTLMFVFGGLFCWGIYLWIGVYVCLELQDYDFSNEILFCLVLLLPLQGVVNLLVYVAPSQLHKICCQTGYGEEISTGTDTFKNLEKELPAVEMMNNLYTDDMELDEDDEPSTIGRSSTFHKFQTMNEKMSFCEGPGRPAIDMLRKRLSTM